MSHVWDDDDDEPDEGPQGSDTGDETLRAPAGGSTGSTEPAPASLGSQTGPSTRPITESPATTPVGPFSAVPGNGPNSGATERDQRPAGPEKTVRHAPNLADTGRDTTGDETAYVPRSESSSENTPGGLDTDEIRAALASGPIVPGQTLFGRYHVEQKLGEGGMGSVWLVRHIELDTLRALKVIVPEFAFDPKARARFRREARLMARLGHPNAVTVHDARMSADGAFIDMEYIAGGTLSQRLEPGVPLPLEQVEHYLEQLCDVIGAAHDLGIVHRDLKPSNIMLIDGRTPGRAHLKVTDFGIAKVYDPKQRTATDGETITQSGGASFTPQYASPEQIGAGQVDGRSDLYSLGVVLYELVVGKRPFAGPRVVYDHLCTPPPPMAEMNPQADVPPEVERVVMWCLAKEPESRPQSARQLAEAFHEAMVASGRAAPAPTSSSRHAPTPPPGVVRPFSGQVAGPGVMTVTQPDTGGHAAGQTATVHDEPEVRRRWWRTALAVVPIVLVLASLGAVARHFLIDGTRPSTHPLPRGYIADPKAGKVGDWPAALVRESDDARFIRIKGGRFTMGDDSILQPGGPRPNPEERPAHPVELSDFYIQETEVTNAQMEAYFKEHGVEPSARPRRWLEAVAECEGRTGKADNYPAVGIPWPLASSYAQWVGGVLPSEAQWEYVARSRGQVRTNVWGNEAFTPGQAILKQHGEGEHAYVVGESIDRTEQGVADMAGNVREWCRDFFAPYQSTADPVLDPVVDQPPAASKNDPTPPEHVIRGGSYSTWIDVGRTTGPRRPSERDGSQTREQVYGDGDDDDDDLGAADDLGFRVVIQWPRK